MIRFVLRGLAFVAVWLGLFFLAGHAPFTPGMTEALLAVTGRLGIRGIEGVEDFYMVLTLVVSLLVAGLVAGVAFRRIGGPPIRR